MIFTSFAFLFAFLPLLLAVYYATPVRQRNWVLLAFSYVFYGWWRLDFTLLLLASSGVTWACGAGMVRAEAAGRRTYLVVAVAFNLGLLAYFKYANFAVEGLNAWLGLGGREPLAWVAVVLPVGISFITFQAISYAVDLYRGAVAPARSAATFATYIALFPQLVAGPIIRYRTIEQDLVERRHSFEGFASGVVLFWIGFNKKVLLANTFGLAADEVFDVRSAGMAGAWLGLLAYTLQIYFDFSGYSDMAVGLGRMFGFRFPRNFDAPYRSQSITEFWRRWHITLSTWIRDYLYISLGGNRGGSARTYRNLMIAMLLAGLWHGASWTFVVWGAFHAFWLIVERRNGRRALYAGLPAPLRIACTWLLVMLAWAVFRSSSLGAAGEFLTNLVDPGHPGFASDVYWLVQPSFLLALAAGLVIVFRGTDAMRMADERRPAVVVVQLGLFVWSVAELLGQGFNPFLYFQF